MATKLWVGTDSGNEGDLSVAANWSPSGVPINADTAVFEHSTQSVTGGLDQSAVTLAQLTIKQSYTGLFGSATAYVQWGATKVDIGEHYGYGSPNGSGRIKLDTGTSTTSICIHDSASTPYSADGNVPPIRLKLTNAAADLYVRKGQVGIAADAPGETTTLDEIHVGYVDSRLTDAKVVIGDGVTLDELQISGGETVLQCAATTIGVQAGQLQTEGAGAITTLTVEGGKVYPQSTGTITTLECKGGEVDFTRSNEDRTVTTPKLWRDAKLKYDPAYVAMTTPPAPQEEMTISTSAS